MPYRLELLGRVQLLSDGRLVGSFAAHRQKLALLAYLALQPDLRATRERVLGVFWPDRDESSARHSLSQLVHEIRREASDLVEATRASVALVAGGFRCDALEFREAAESGDHERAVELYGGNLLEGLSLSISPDFEHWAEAERAQLMRLHRRVCRERVAALRDRGELEAAIASTRRWLEADPFEDEAHRCLIELLYQSGDRSGALEQYERYAKLCREMEVEPLDETRALSERIRTGEAAPVRAEPRSPAVPAEAAQGVSPGELAPPAPGRRPLPPRAALSWLGLPRLAHVIVLALGLAWAAVEVGKQLLDRQLIAPWAFFPLLFLLAVGLFVSVGLTWAGERRRAGVDAAPAGSGGTPWLRWTQKVHGGHVRGVLGALVLVFLSWLFLLERGWTEAASTVAAETSFPPTRVAVLYFDDHSAQQDLGYLAAGMTDNLIHELQQVSALEVISRSGVKAFKDADVPLDSIVRALHVGTVVEGSLTRSGDRLSVTVRLVESPGLTQMESRVLERPWGEHLAMRNALAEEVAEILRRRLGVEIELRRRRAETQSDQAWALVRRAESLEENAEELQALGDTVATARLLDEADALLAAAEALDEHWVEPIVLRGRVAYGRATSAKGATPRVPAKPWLARAIAHANRALQRDPRNAAALELRGLMRYHLREQSDSAEASRLLTLAESDLREAVALDPYRALAWITLSDLLRVRARFVEANGAAKRALEADPFLKEAEFVIFNLYQTSLELEDLSAASYWCGEARAKFPEAYWPWSCAIFLMALPGGLSPDLKKAGVYFESFERRVPPARRDLFVPAVRMYFAAVLARAGRTDSARALMHAAREEAEAATSPDPLKRLLYYEAYIRLLLGEPDNALALLAEFLKVNPQRRDYIAKDWLWRSLRGDPRFQALVGADR